MAESAEKAADEGGLLQGDSSPWEDLALTLPIFVGYHLGVVFLPVRNAADVVTQELVALANNNLLAYGGLTLAIGAVFVGTLVALGRGHALRWHRFALVVVEGIVFAMAMRLFAGWLVGRMFLATGVDSRFAGLVMSLGAGFYEEIAFRVILFGLGAKLLMLLFPLLLPFHAVLVKIGWAVAAAAIFSGWHYVGALGDAFDPKTFAFRLVCGLVFTVIYVFRGFAPAVWTHALYDIWVLAL
jgi:hypothetical protein